MLCTNLTILGDGTVAACPDARSSTGPRLVGDGERAGSPPTGSGLPPGVLVEGWGPLGDAGLPRLELVAMLIT